MQHIAFTFPSRTRAKNRCDIHGFSHDISLFPVDTQEAVHEAFAKELGFPAHCGKNLDALYDCLGEIAEPTRVTLYDLAGWRRRLGADFCRRLAAVLASAAKENPSFRACWTLLPAP